MNDSELELRLREELRRSVRAPDAPPTLYGHVSRLGADDPTRSVDWRTPARGARAITPGLRNLGRGARVLSTLAATLAIVALLAVGLAWRNSPSTTSLRGTSPSQTQAAPTGEPSQSAAIVPSPTPSPVPTPEPTWSVAPAGLSLGGRVGPLFAWAVSGTPGRLYVTTNGGRSWQDRTPPDLAGKFQFQVANPQSHTDLSGPHDIEFRDPLDGWFVYEQNVGRDAGGNYQYAHFLYRTVDGGSTWTRTEFAAPGPYWLVRFQWLDSAHAYGLFMGGANMNLVQLWATADGGETWSLSADVDTRKPGYTDWPVSFVFTTPLEGWGVSMYQGPGVLHTLDGGRTWVSSALPYDFGTSFGFGVDQFPVPSTGRLTISAEVSTSTAADGSQTGDDWVTWGSTDGGSHWVLDSVLHLGDVVKLGSAWPGTIVFLDRFTAKVQLFDVGTRTFTETVDAASVCGTGNGADGSVISALSAFSATDLWLSCSHAPTKSAASADYVYGTTDGGLTWRLLMKS